MYHDPNLPFEGFFEANIKALIAISQNGGSANEMNEKWADYIDNGTETIRHETDDKTMVLAVLKGVYDAS